MKQVQKLLKVNLLDSRNVPALMTLRGVDKFQLIIPYKVLDHFFSAFVLLYDVLEHVDVDDVLEEELLQWAAVENHFALGQGVVRVGELVQDEAFEQGLDFHYAVDKPLVEFRAFYHSRSVEVLFESQAEFLFE